MCIYEYVYVHTDIDSRVCRAGKHLHPLLSQKQGSQYWRFDPSQRPPVKGSYPKPISNWEGLPNNIDDALQYSNGYTYFFKVRLKDEKEERKKKRGGRFSNSCLYIPV